MHSKHTKLFLTFFLFMIIFFNIFLSLDLGNSHYLSCKDSILFRPDENPNNYDLHSSDPLISTLIIRPNDSLSNSGFSIFSESSIHAAIDDNVLYNNSGGDTDYIRGENFTHSCEVQMGPNLLSSQDKVIGIKIYARGRKYGGPGDITSLYVSFSWRLGTEPYSSSNSLRFEESFFYWLSTASWNNLDLTKEDMNDFRVRIRILNFEPDKYQDVSVMYVELTVRTNRAPDVNIINPLGGEDLQDQATIEWTYSDLDEETVYFNITYDLGDNNWLLIISGLINETSYLWDFGGITETNYTVQVRVIGFDANGGQSESISGIFTVRVNRDPNINLISPIGGEILQDQAIINWTYSDPDEETVYFNISYDLGDNEWNLIVSGLLNATSYSWNLSNFTQTQSVVRVKIECNDGYGGYAVNISSGYFTIKANNEVDGLEFLIRFISIGSIVGVSGALVVGVFYRQKKKKDGDSDKRSKKPDPFSNGTQNIITNKNGSKKIIIEADILVKKGEKYSEKDLLTNFLSQGNISKKNENDDEYEVIKILGKINITTLSEDFWEKIEHFEWEKDDKEDFINDMLALPPNCREEFLNEMLERFNGG